MNPKKLDSAKEQFQTYIRESILDATVILINEKGFDATTVEQIAERANIGKGTLYNYFKNKEHLLGALFLRKLDTLDEGLLNIQSSNESFIIQFKKSVGYILNNMVSNIALSKALMERSCQGSHEGILKEKLEKQLDTIAIMMQKGISEGALKKESPNTYALTLMGLIHGFSKSAFMALKQNQSVTLSTRLNFIIDFFLNGAKNEH